MRERVFYSRLKSLKRDFFGVKWKQLLRGDMDALLQRTHNDGNLVLCML